MKLPVGCNQDTKAERLPVVPIGNLEPDQTGKTWLPYADTSSQAARPASKVTSQAPALHHNWSKADSRVKGLLLHASVGQDTARGSVQSHIDICDPVIRPTSGPGHIVDAYRIEASQYLQRRLGYETSVSGSPRISGQASAFFSHSGGCLEAQLC
ncbi:hypothetical protein LX36DRAFT_6593 [Colletotrichum falcatum]|nr:hypothetical protein LX36DRAFT_6593 [Colletotrichum falcatum]